MFLNLFLVEWKKSTGNRMLSIFTLWIYPIGLLAFLVFVNLATAFTDDAVALFDLDTVQWTVMIGPWFILTRFPYSIMLGIPMMAFLTVSFAGEYEWSTWKNIVPLNRRAVIIAGKTVTLMSAMLLSLFLTSVISLIGWGVASVIAGFEYGLPPTGSLLAEFAVQYLLEVALAAATLLVLSGFAALSTIVTRSMVGGLLASFMVWTLELLSGFFLQLLAFLFDRPAISSLVQYMPSYSMGNIRSRILDGVAFIPTTMPGMSLTVEPSLGFSVVVLLVWIVGLLALNVYLFGRQDLAS